jgi:hypothetical protein
MPMRENLYIAPREGRFLVRDRVERDLDPFASMR